MRHLDQDPKNTLSQDIQHGRRQAQTSWMATGRERGRDALWGNSDASREGAAQLPVSKERPEPRVSAQGREGLWRSTQSSGQQRQGTIYSEREEEGLRWRDGIGGSPNGSEMGSKPSLIKEQRGWIEKLVSWELGGRMVRKKKRKGPFESEMGREIIEEGKRESEKPQPEEQREEKEETAGTEAREGLEGTAAPGRGGKPFQDLRLRQNETEGMQERWRARPPGFMAAIQRPANCLRGCLWEF